MKPGNRSGALEFGLRRNRAPACLLLALWAVWTGGCAARNTVTVHISRASVEQQLAARFPIEKRALFLKFVFRDPKVAFSADHIGIGAAARVEASPHEAVTGRLSIDGRLHYDPNAGDFVMTNVRLVNATLDTVPPELVPILKPLGGTVAVLGALSEVCKIVPPHLSDIKLGQLPDDWKGRAAKAVVRSVTVQGDGLDVEVGLPKL